MARRRNYNRITTWEFEDRIAWCFVEGRFEAEAELRDLAQRVGVPISEPIIADFVSQKREAITTLTSR